MAQPKTTSWEIMGVTVKGLPLRGKGQHAGVHADDIKAAEQQVAHIIIERGFPLRGQEVQFLRKLFGLSLEKFASNFGLTGSGVRKWEEEKKLFPLELTTQIALRIFFASKLGIKIPTDFSSIKGKETAPKNVTIEFSQRPFAA